MAGQTANVYYASWHIWHCARQLGPTGNTEMWSLPSQVAVQVGKQGDRTQARKHVSVGSMGAVRMQKWRSLYPTCTQPRGEVRRLASFREQLASFCSTWGPEQGSWPERVKWGCPLSGIWTERQQHPKYQNLTPRVYVGSLSFLVSEGLVRKC